MYQHTMPLWVCVRSDPLTGVWSACCMKTEKDNTDVIMRPTQPHSLSFLSWQVIRKQSAAAQLHLFHLSLSLCPVPACHPHYAPVLHSTWPPGAARFYHPPHSSAIKTQPTNTKCKFSCTPVINLLWDKRDGIFQHRKTTINKLIINHIIIVIFWIVINNTNNSVTFCRVWSYFLLCFIILLLDSRTLS